MLNASNMVDPQFRNIGFQIIQCSVEINTQKYVIPSHRVYIWYEFKNEL